MGCYRAASGFGLKVETKGRDVPKRKRGLSKAERRARKERKENFMTIFINGKQKRVRRPRQIDGLPVDEFIARNADPIWLHQNGLWEFMIPDNED
jgi:3'-phosphoadenosine 5'-phosphosulfate sulfotransferase